MQELKRELASSHFNNISHMNNFWREQFVEYVGQVLEDQVEIRDHQLMAKLTADSSITIETLVDNWFDKMLTGSDGVILESLNPIRS
jgi:hypothetical protein